MAPLWCCWRLSPARSVFSFFFFLFRAIFAILRFVFTSLILSLSLSLGVFPVIQTQIVSSATRQRAAHTCLWCSAACFNVSHNLERLATRERADALLGRSCAVSPLWGGKNDYCVAEYQTFLWLFLKFCNFLERKNTGQRSILHKVFSSCLASRRCD